ncbi:hypothetical protein COV06_03775 [Candidatus Uhrbacteria bacterium CG10_big_fil_rev_8_21_14_0_10_50_16]|uniref:Cell division protein FtsX n=1 Tax=Candidatus Uhrbacteria bacterium CG10_big_fil_rev_8_21_14_0_10_50_16 TaxID=1975039 RepID=A0A2H0RLK0_9BACT|nr:MAG: hypothetical protein COV06_03775 [Candidatus Uhrbacteria bacterium CG10_big_fil_rev_8_21_14_0_10_50_16]
MRTLHRTTKFALQNIGRNIWLSVATVLVFVLTLSTINILITLHVLTDAAIQSVEDQIDVSVYFKKGTSEEIIFGAQDYVSSLSQVSKVEYVSGEEALKRFSERHRYDARILEALTVVETNPFGGELIVSARNTDDFAFILEALKNPTFGNAIESQDFSDHERVIQRIDAFTQRVQLFALVLAGIFALIAVLIVLNSIRVSIYTHREEIGIMKLVGASNSFVRLPFIIEGIIFSLLATLITAAIVFPTAASMEPQLAQFFESNTIGLSTYYLQNWYWIFGGQFLALAVLSTVASALAMGRYLRV